MASPEGLEYLFLHRVTEIAKEEWERMRQYLIGTPGVGPRYVWEPDPKHRHEPVHHLDIRGMVLGSRTTQPRAVDYFVRGALVESEIYGRMEKVRTSYFKLLGEVTSLRAGRRVDSKGTTETPVLGASEIDKLGRSLRRARGRLGDWTRLFRKGTVL
ncbi:uncharacterized protein A4U43_C07F2780 [Asparagus officinalis]|uniref:Uncharacterized protein n=1 Tax=Asparagus officinalis TaxID=4686 RepID=A0A5P1EE28_ASPOF|nr:uncharacterized protein A4U43_C07F2780 [Asparagus officinalis]